MGRVRAWDGGGGRVRVGESGEWRVRVRDRGGGHVRVRKGGGERVRARDSGGERVRAQEKEGGKEGKEEGGRTLSPGLCTCGWSYRALSHSCVVALRPFTPVRARMDYSLYRRVCLQLYARKCSPTETILLQSAHGILFRYNFKIFRMLHPESLQLSFVQ